MERSVSLTYGHHTRYEEYSTVLNETSYSVTSRFSQSASRVWVVPIAVQVRLAGAPSSLEPCITHSLGLNWLMLRPVNMYRCKRTGSG